MISARWRIVVRARLTRCRMIRADACMRLEERKLLSPAHIPEGPDVLIAEFQLPTLTPRRHSKPIHRCRQGQSSPVSPGPNGKPSPWDAGPRLFPKVQFSATACNTSSFSLAVGADEAPGSRRRSRRRPFVPFFLQFHSALRAGVRLLRLTGGVDGR